MTRFYFVLCCTMLVTAIGCARNHEHTKAEPASSYSREEGYMRFGRAEKEESPGSLIVGVDALALFKAVAPEYKECPDLRRQVGPSGVKYRLIREGPEEERLRYVYLIVGVFESRERAMLACGRAVLGKAVGLPALSGLGDRGYVGTAWTGTSTHFVFRRKNVVVSFGIHVPREEAIDIAKEIDDKLEHDTTVVAGGEKVVLPELRIRGLPGTIGLKRSVECELEFVNVDPEEALLDSESRGVAIRRTRGEAPTLVYHSPKLEEQTGLKKITVFLADQKNVITTKEYTITVTDDKE